MGKAAKERVCWAVQGQMAGVRPVLLVASFYSEAKAMAFELEQRGFYVELWEM